MRVVAIATPRFALPTLEALHTASALAAVITNPDRPRGRGLEPGPTPAKEWARARGVRVYTTDKLTADPARGRIELAECLPIFALVVVASGLFIPKWLREDNAEYSLHGAVNLHPSLLPALRGAAPINWAILRGLATTGVTTMRLAREIDAGDILMQKEVVIAPRETAGTLAAKLAGDGAALVLETLRGLAGGAVTPRPQDHDKATPAPKITAEIREVDWTRAAGELDRLVRGLLPDFPARATLGGELVQIWEAAPAGEGRSEGAGGEPGTITAIAEGGLTVACGEGELRLTRLKPAGRGEMTAHAFAVGRRLAPGDRFAAGGAAGR